MQPRRKRWPRWRRPSGSWRTLRDQLEVINQNNLIKLLLVLSYEIYSTVDQTMGASQSAVQSFMNHGISYTLGRVAFENAGDAARKAMGLNESNYLSPRCASVRRVTEAAVLGAQHGGAGGCDGGLSERRRLAGAARGLCA